MIQLHHWHFKSNASIQYASFWSR